MDNTTNILTKFSRISFLLICCLLISQSCNTQKNVPQNMSTTNEYIELWKSFEKKLNNGMNKDATATLDSIFNTSVSENNDPQILKTFFKRYISESYQEDNLAKQIIYIEFNLGLLSTQTGQSIAYSYLGELYKNYLNRNVYRLRNNTTIESDEYPLDIQDYSISQLLTKANEYIHLSLEGEESRSISIDNYSAILSEFGDKGKKYRNTIYDLLIFRAISHFSSSNNFLPESTNAFNLYQEEAFAQSESFIKFDFKNVGDSTALKEVVLLFQNIERENFENTPKLLHIQLARLTFVYQNSTNDDKNKLYTNSLVKLLKDHRKSEVAFEIGTQLISQYINRGNTPSLNSENKNTYFISAIEVINQLRSNELSTEEKKHLQSLEENINAGSLSISTEAIYPLDIDFPINISFKNIKALNATLYSLDENEIKDFYESRNSGSKSIIGEKIKSWEIDLPEIMDYDQHSYEYVLESLPSGNYIIELEAKNRKIRCYSKFHISSIAAVKVGNGLQIMDRMKGTPLPAKVDLYTRSWERRRSVLNFVKTIESDASGKVTFEQKNENYLVKIRTAAETLFFDDQFYIQNQNYRQNNTHILHFTDRSIYRPGQTIFYKAVLYNNLANNTLSNKTIKIDLLDANYQQIASITKKTNDFGSINGEFELPTDLLNGTFTLKFNHSESRTNVSHQIQVEEYKRPTFKIDFNDLKETYSFNKNVECTGIVQTYNDIPLDNQKVEYTIERNQIYRWYYYRYYTPLPSKIIANGSVLTDDSGVFKIDFIPEKPKTNNRYNSFSYTIKVKITDIRGETRNESYTLYVSDKDFIINTDKQSYNSNDEKIDISLTNQAGNSINEQVKIEVYSLKENNTFFIDKKWKSEFISLEKNEYYKRTIYYPYKEENKIENLEIEKVVSSSTENIDSLFSFNLANLKTGLYKCVISSEKADTVNVFFENNADSFIGKKALSVEGKSKINVSDHIDLLLISPHKLYIYETVLRQLFNETSKNYSFNKTKQVKYSTTNRDEGGMRLHYFTFYNNRFISEQQNIAIIDPAKTLKLEWETKRSELYPGSQEKWRLKVLNNKNQVIPAELVATMYDKSLDVYKAHNWNIFNISSSLKYLDLRPLSNGLTYSRIFNDERRNYHQVQPIQYPYINTEINLFGGMLRSGSYGIRSRNKRFKSATEGVEMSMEAPMAMEVEEEMDDVSVRGNRADATEYYVDGIRIGDVDASEQKKEAEESEDDSFIRTNLNETVFFKPELITNSKGEILLEFTMNEALTEWKMLAFGHTKKLQNVLNEESVKTKKDLMVFPNGPRFFRLGDKITVPAKVRNMTEETLLAEAKIKIFDLLTNKDVTDIFLDDNASKSIKITANSSSNVEWNLNIPKGIEGVRYQISAITENFKDGEEKTALVVDNRKLVNESRIYVIDQNSSETLINELKKGETIDAKNFTVSVVSNPSWMAVQSLPYLMEYRYKCTEQIFSRYFSNSIAKYILDENPDIETVYSSWKANNQLKSPLSKNEELKYALIEQSPWVVDALNEEAQMENMANLFDKERVQAELSTNKKIILSRSNNGGLPWFPGGRPNTYITQYVLQGFGQLRMLGAIDNNDSELTNFYRQGMQFVEQEINKRERNRKAKKTYVSPLDIHFLYTTSLFPEIELNSETKRNIKKWEKIIKEDWTSYSLLNKGQLAIYFDRNDNKEVAKTILESLRQTSIYKEDLGRYWKETNGYFWYQSNLEAQSMLMLAFDQVANDTEFVEELKHWLLSNKQTNKWNSTKSTTQAIYSILETGENALASQELVKINGFNSSNIEQSPVKKAVGEYSIKYLNEDVANVPKTAEVVNPNSHKAWVSTTYQYVEDLDKIENYQETPLKVKRQLFIKKITNSGDVLTEIKSGNEIKVGDEIVIKLILEVDRPMEFIHIQDSRASGTEPKNVISSYQYSNGLYFYEETKDEATNFFLDFLPRGIHSFEYEVYASQKGDFSAGLATIQSMYAPEFNAHSDGIRIQIK